MGALLVANYRRPLAYCASLGTAGALIYHQNALWALLPLVPLFRLYDDVRMAFEDKYAEGRPSTR